MIELDLHIHSHHSYDSRLPVEKIIKTARERRLDGIAVTDHDSFAGSREAMNRCPSDLLIVPGMELRTTDYDDLLALFIDEPLDPQPFVDAVERIHDLGGVAILPHPYRKFDQVPERILAAIDGLEGLNARSRSSTNERARELGERVDLPLLGSSDAHTAREIGRSTTLLPEESGASIGDVRRALERGTVGIRGGESPYYLYHGLSVLMEGINSVVD